MPDTQEALIAGSLRWESGGLLFLTVTTWIAESGQLKAEAYVCLDNELKLRILLVKQHNKEKGSVYR